MICVKHKIMDSAARRAEARASAGWDYFEWDLREKDKWYLRKS